MKSKTFWIILLVVILVGAGIFFRDQIPGLGNGETAAQGEDTTSQRPQTVAIRPATDTAQVSAAGNIALAGQQAVGFTVDGMVTDILVEVGDEVAVGDVLLNVDGGDLDLTVQRAELDVELQQAQLDLLKEPADESDIAVAQANLVSAQEKLAEVLAGPSQTELQAAEMAVTVAQAKYEELLAGPSEAELTQLSVELHKLTIDLKQAQEAYDQIAYRDSIGSSSQAITLQQTTIDYDAAKAAYEIATEPPSEAEVQEALKAIQDAQRDLETLQGQPTKSEVATAEAEVIQNQAELDKLLADPSDIELKEAELNLAQAQLDLAEAQAQLGQVELRSPVAGTVLSVDVEVGQQVNAGTNVVTLTDLTALELTINVAEVDISKVQIGQKAQISIDAFPDQAFSGAVSRIAPASESEGGVVNYPVTVRLEADNLAGVRPGMTAVATMTNERDNLGWLVPTNALVEFEGETTVLVMRRGEQIRVTVVPESSQGEWTVVQSSELQEGDRVVGQVATFLNEDNGGGRGGPFGPPRR